MQSSICTALSANGEHRLNIEIARCQQQRGKWIRTAVAVARVSRPEFSWRWLTGRETRATRIKSTERRVQPRGEFFLVVEIAVDAVRHALGAERLKPCIERFADGPVQGDQRIARDCGFGSEETMRRSFLRILAVPPHAYRERFPV